MSSWDGPKIRDVLRSLRGPLKCLLPFCQIFVRASAGSVLLSIELVIDQNYPEDPSITIAVARDAANALVANFAELSSILNMTVLATTNVTTTTGLSVPIVVAPPPPSQPPSPPRLPGTVCTDECIGSPYYASDGACDDGGPGEEFSFCAYGTDCYDCGVRQGPSLPPSPLPPPSPPPSPPQPHLPPPPSAVAAASAALAGAAHQQHLQFTWEQSAAVTALFFALLTFSGLLIYVAVKNGFCACCIPEKPSVSASGATPAGVSMTSSQASNKVLEVKIDGKPVQLKAERSLDTTPHASTPPDYNIHPSTVAEDEVYGARKTEALDTRAQAGISAASALAGSFDSSIPPPAAAYASAASASASIGPALALVAADKSSLAPTVELALRGGLNPKTELWLQASTKQLRAGQAHE